MQLTAADLKPIVEPLVKELIAEFVRENELKAKELSLIERIVRVEEELKALHKVLMVMEEANQKRFEALHREMDKRFEALQRELDTRFEALEKRLNFTQWMIGIGFSLMGLLITAANFLAR